MKRVLIGALRCANLTTASGRVCLVLAVGARLTGAVAEHPRRMEDVLILNAVAPLLPPLLVLELVRVQRHGLLYAVRVTELHRQLRGGATHLGPRRAERELLGDGAD